jgi:hypothetical protein
VLTATRLLRQAASWGYLPVGEIIRSDTPGTFAMALRKPVLRADELVQGLHRVLAAEPLTPPNGEPRNARRI